MTILHIVRKGPEGLLKEILWRRQEESATVLLLQDAVHLRNGVEKICGGIKVFSGRDDLVSRGLAPGEGSLTYAEIVTKIFDSDRVVSW